LKPFGSDERLRVHLLGEASPQYSAPRPVPISERTRVVQKRREHPIVEEIVAVIGHDLGFGQYPAVLRDVSVEDIQQDLDHWLEDYDQVRPHQGRWSDGKTP